MKFEIAAQFTFFEKKNSGIFFFDQIFYSLLNFRKWLKECQSSNFIKNIKDLRQEFYEFIQNNINAIEFNSIHQFEDKIQF